MEGGTSAPFALMLSPWSLCTSAFWVFQCLSLKIILNGRASCRDAHLRLVIPGDERGRNRRVRVGAWLSWLAKEPWPGGTAFFGWCSTCHERALVT